MKKKVPLPMNKKNLDKELPKLKQTAPQVALATLMEQANASPRVHEPTKNIFAKKLNAAKGGMPAR